MDEFGERPIRGRAKEAHKAFVALLSQSTPRLWVTYALAAASVLVFLAMPLGGVNPLAPEVEGLISFGARYGPRVAKGEWWRLLTCGFVHVGIYHIAFNLALLFWVGRIVERLYGNVAFLAIFVLSIAGGSIASLAVHPTVVGAGASGGVFGVLGALLVFMRRNQGVVPRHILVPLTAGGMGYVVLNLVFGVLVPGINNAAHVGGLVAGIAAALCAMRRLPPERERQALLAARTAGLAVAFAGLAAGVIAWIGPDVVPPGTREAQAARIYEIVVRHEIGLLRESAPDVKGIYVRIDGKDPAPAFLQRIAEPSFYLRPGSGAFDESGQPAPDNAGGLRRILDLRPLRWRSDLRVDFGGRSRIGPYLQVPKTYRVEWQEGHWTLVSVKDWELP